MSIQQVCNYLESHFINPSVQRVAIMKYMFEQYLSHPTVEQIYAGLLPSMPTLSKATVYNTLRLFVEKKAIIPILIEERNVRYDLNIKAHAHFRCRSCGGIHDVPLEKSDIPKFRGNPECSPGDAQVYFLGACRKCTDA